METLSTALKDFRSERRRGREVGMTLFELLVSTGVFSLLVLGIVYTQLFYSRYHQLVNSKLGASDMSLPVERYAWRNSQTTAAGAETSPKGLSDCM